MCLVSKEKLSAFMCIVIIKTAISKITCWLGIAHSYMNCKLGITTANCEILEGCKFGRTCFEIYFIQIFFYSLTYLLDPYQVVSPGDKNNKQFII